MGTSTEDLLQRISAERSRLASLRARMPYGAAAQSALNEQAMADAEAEAAAQSGGPMGALGGGSGAGMEALGGLMGGGGAGSGPAASGGGSGASASSAPSSGWGAVGPAVAGALTGSQQQGGQGAGPALIATPGQGSQPPAGATPSFNPTPTSTYIEEATPSGAQAQTPAGQGQGTGSPPSGPALANSQQGSAPPSPQEGLGTQPLTSEKIVEQTPPTKVLDTLETSQRVVASTSANNPEAAKQAEDALKAKGIDVPKAYADLRDSYIDKALKDPANRDLTAPEVKQLKGRWSNVFSIVPREQFGLFMMDFGLRMLAASGNSEGVAADAGKAAYGALGNVQARQAEQRQRRADIEKTASAQAADVIQMELEKRKTDAQVARDEAMARNQSRITEQDIVVDDTGTAMYDRGDGKGLQPVMVNGKPMKVPADRRYGAGGDKPYAQEIVLANLKAAGYSHREAMDLIQGAPTDAEMVFRFSQEFSDLIKAEGRGTPPGGKQAKRYKEWSAPERRAWIEQRLQEIKSITRQSTGAAPPAAAPAGAAPPAAAPGRAAPPAAKPSGAAAPSGLPQRPKNWEKYPPSL